MDVIEEDYDDKISRTNVEIEDNVCEFLLLSAVVVRFAFRPVKLEVSCVLLMRACGCPFLGSLGDDN